MAFNSNTNLQGQTEYSAISKYNEAGLQILRLHDYWSQCEEYAEQGKLISWKWKLDAIWRELVADVNRQKECKKIININNSIKNKISKAKTRSELYYELNRRHEFLKIVQNKVGKGGSYRNPDEEGL